MDVDGQEGDAIGTASVFVADVNGSSPSNSGALSSAARLGAGDALFIPAGWFHQVRAVQVSVPTWQIASTHPPQSDVLCTQVTSAAVGGPLHVAVNFWLSPNE